jgi:hypothetical protein
LIVGVAHDFVSLLPKPRAVIPAAAAPLTDRNPFPAGATGGTERPGRALAARARACDVAAQYAADVVAHAEARIGTPAASSTRRCRGYLQGKERNIMSHLALS